MDDPVRVEIVKSVHELLRYLADLWLRKLAIIFKDLKELPLSEFCNHAELMGSFKRVKQQNDVLMVETFQNVDFLAKVVELLLSFAPDKEKIKPGYFKYAYFFVINLSATT